MSVASGVIDYEDKPEGPIAAAIIAGGVGAASMGLLTTAAAASSSARDWLRWSDRVGPLSGETTVTVIVWLLAWAVLHMIYRHRASETRRALAIALVLFGAGVVGTFPPFFHVFV